MSDKELYNKIYNGLCEYPEEMETETKNLCTEQRFNNILHVMTHNYNSNVLTYDKMGNTSFGLSNLLENAIKTNDYFLALALSKKQDLDNVAINKLLSYAMSLASYDSRDRILFSLLRNPLKPKQLQEILSKINKKFITIEYGAGISSKKNIDIHQSNTDYFCEIGETFNGLALHFLSKNKIQKFIDSISKGDTKVGENETSSLINNPNTTKDQIDFLFKNFDCDYEMIKKVGHREMIETMYESAMESFEMEKPITEEIANAQDYSLTVISQFLKKKLLPISIQKDLLNRINAFDKENKHIASRVLAANTTTDMVAKYLMKNDDMLIHILFNENVSDVLKYWVLKSIYENEIMPSNDKRELLKVYSDIKTLIDTKTMYENNYVALFFYDDSVIDTMIACSGYTPENVLNKHENALTSYDKIDMYGFFNLELREKLKQHKYLYDNQDYLKYTVTNIMDNIVYTDDSSMVTSTHLYGAYKNQHYVFNVARKDAIEVAKNMLLDRKITNEFCNKVINAMSTDIQQHKEDDLYCSITELTENLDYNKIPNDIKKEFYNSASVDELSYFLDIIYHYIIYTSDTYELCNKTFKSKSIIKDIYEELEERGIQFGSLFKEDVDKNENER